MREIRSSGSAEGVVGNCDPYSDSPEPLVVKQLKFTRVKEPTLLWRSNASCHSKGCESLRQNIPVTVVVIPSGEEGDRLVGSLEVKVPMAG
jgi:hypothetical protein